MPAATQTQLPSDLVEQLGQYLFAAFESGSAIEPITAAHPAMTVTDAYGVQRALLERHARLGRRAAGHKIGLTSRAIQQQLGVASPDFGVVLDSHVFGSGAAISRSGLKMVAPRLEAEVAFVLDDELRGPGITAQDVIASTRAVVPVFELIDSRIRDWRITLADTIADNAAFLGAVIGVEVAPADVGPVASLSVSFGRDGTVLEQGDATAVMGDPAAAVAWLANELAGFGEALPAGKPVLSGSFTAAVDATPGHYEASFGERLGTVSVEILA
jgi:2-keto-4-pentenoate hydratase